MLTILLIIHLILCVALTGLILLQQSEGGALGMGGGGGPGSFMTGRAAANVLTRSTTILGVLFFASSLGLTLLSNTDRAPRSVVEQPAPAGGLPTGPITLPGSSAPAAQQPAIPEPQAAPAAPAPSAPPAEQPKQ
jgi:preprotein translocase subunit SecG